MSLDRRIVSILYFNGIEDVLSVQEFLGEKDGYFEIKINDEVRKLKIPGHDYPQVEENVIPKKLKKEIKDVIEIIKEEVKEKVEEVKEDAKEFVENIKEVSGDIKDDIKEFIEDIKEDIKKDEELDGTLEGGEFKILEEEVKEIPKKTTKSKKLKIVESKDDIDDFINLA